MALPPQQADQLGHWARDARQRTFDLVSNLTDAQLRVPLLDIVNPILWEIGHIAWFQEKWVLRHAARQTPILPDADALYDSSAVAHGKRWDLRLPSREETLSYMREVCDRVVSRVNARRIDTAERDFHLLAIFHEDMHGEAFAYTFQSLGYSAPQFCPARGCDTPATACLADDARVPGGRFSLGAGRNDGFVFDNEQWAHPLEVAPFAIARAPVTQTEFARFVDAGGYADRAFWTDGGWAWRSAIDARHPLYFRPAGNPAGDSAFGCRQMLGNVWEWTATDFGPYPGFAPGPYKEYSEPWFGTRKVLRGGSWTTRARMLRNTWRNFFTPDRRDVFAGFRTCCLEPVDPSSP